MLAFMMNTMKHHHAQGYISTEPQTLLHKSDGITTIIIHYSSDEMTNVTRSILTRFWAICHRYPSSIRSAGRNMCPYSRLSYMSEISQDLHGREEHILK